MNERLRAIREHTKLSRAAFGARLGISGDVINNLERGRVAVKEHIIKLVCNEFNINEKWLRTGDGEPFVQPDTFSLDDFVKSKDASELELEILKIYFELPPEVRKAAVNHFRSRLLSAVAESPALLIPDTAEELERICPPVELNSEKHNAG